MAHVDHFVALLRRGRLILEHGGTVQTGLFDLGQPVDNIVVLGALAVDPALRGKAPVFTVVRFGVADVVGRAYGVFFVADMFAREQFVPEAVASLFANHGAGPDKAFVRRWQ